VASGVPQRPDRRDRLVPAAGAAVVIVGVGRRPVEADLDGQALARQGQQSGQARAAQGHAVGEHGDAQARLGVGDQLEDVR